MRLWAVNTEKAEEKSPVVGAIMIRNNTEQWFPRSGYARTMGEGQQGRRLHYDRRKHPGLPGSTPTQCPRALSVFGNDKGALQWLSPNEVSHPPTVRHNSSQLLRAKAKDAFR